MVYYFSMGKFIDLLLFYEEKEYQQGSGPDEKGTQKFNLGSA